MSFVMASDFRVGDFDGWWDGLGGGRRFVRSIGARHFVVYRSMDDPRRVFVTIGVRSDHPLPQVLRSSDLFEWYDLAGVEAIPPLFVGRLIEKLDYVDDPQTTHGSVPGGEVIVATIMRVADVGRFLSEGHARRDWRVAAGCRRYWTYQALDDEVEIMTLVAVNTEEQAAEWLRQRETLQVFFDLVGVGTYPDVFVGRLVADIELDAAAGA